MTAINFSSIFFSENYLKTKTIVYNIYCYCILFTLIYLFGMNQNKQGTQIPTADRQSIKR